MSDVTADAASIVSMFVIESDTPACKRTDRRQPAFVAIRFQTAKVLDQLLREFIAGVISHAQLAAGVAYCMQVEERWRQSMVERAYRDLQMTPPPLYT
jgi:hypothetical protein